MLINHEELLEGLTMQDIEDLYDTQLDEEVAQNWINPCNSHRWNSMYYNFDSTSWTLAGVNACHGFGCDNCTAEYSKSNGRYTHITCGVQGRNHYTTTWWNGEGHNQFVVHYTRCR